MNGCVACLVWVAGLWAREPVVHGVIVSVCSRGRCVNFSDLPVRIDRLRTMDAAR